MTTPAPEPTPAPTGPPTGRPPAQGVTDVTDPSGAGLVSRRGLFGLSLAGLAVLVAGCDSAAGDTASGSASGSISTGTGLWNASKVHTIELTIDQSAYDAMITKFKADGTKDWVTAKVVIDGTTFDKVGAKLKGNSSLRGLQGNGNGNGGGGMPGQDELSSSEPQGLPWRIRLDKYVDGQNFEGAADVVVRANNTESSLNEAVALALLGRAGLATQQASPVAFRVNGSDPKLRLVIENPDNAWDRATFGDAGVLYKAEAEGDYSYRGESASSYTTAFEIEASTDHKDDDYAPLIAFLKWLNQSTDEAFAADLDDHLEVTRFARYLAFQSLIDNFDDIDGPGNNSYLRYTDGTKRMTVVAWDHNLAFGGMGGMGGGRGGQGGGPGGGPGGGQRPSGMPSGFPSGAAGQGGGGRGGFGRENTLSKRFTANTTFSDLVTEQGTELRSELYAGGAAKQVLDSWVAVLKSGASELISAETLTSEANKIAGYFTATSSGSATGSGTGSGGSGSSGAPSSTSATSAAG